MCERNGGKRSSTSGGAQTARTSPTSPARRAPHKPPAPRRRARRPPSRSPPPKSIRITTNAATPTPSASGAIQRERKRPAESLAERRCDSVSGDPILIVHACLTPTLSAAASPGQAQHATRAMGSTSRDLPGRWRRGRDSNPRVPLQALRFSRPARSTTLPPLTSPQRAGVCIVQAARRDNTPCADHFWSLTGRGPA